MLFFQIIAHYCQIVFSGRSWTPPSPTSLPRSAAAATLAGGEEGVTKEDNNRSVATLTLVSRAAGKLDVRAGCVCGERCAGSSPQPLPRVRRVHVGARGHSRDCRDFSSTQVTLWKYSILYTIPDVWHSYIDIFSCISVFTHLLSCRKDQPRQRCTDCLKTKRRNASAFLEQLRWSNQAPAGKWNRWNPIQVSLYFKSNIAWFHIIINDKCFLMSILGFPGCLAPSQTDIQRNWSGHLAI